MTELLLSLYALKNEYLQEYAKTFDRSILAKIVYIQNSIDILESMIDVSLMNDANLN